MTSNPWVLDDGDDLTISRVAQVRPHRSQQGGAMPISEFSETAYTLLVAASAVSVTLCAVALVLHLALRSE
ncbi:hypothetical protein [Hyphomicrobium zavarzinii]|uniref:hypothetical protein n=1 Tax=Hyphomicrobium zavarzinii TaxID=48292 RepID=UPI002357DDFC|nr:hypothetical protein [Hyphomicrobium zavarzinii]